MADEKKEDWRDTNVGLIGSQEDKDHRKKCANAEPAWLAIDQKKPGILVWRIEHFTVVPVPPEDYGKFHKGDTYMVLNTWKKPDEDELMRDIHFVIGTESTADEYGSAAYKTVELDDFFDGEPGEHRHEMENETEEFKALFGDKLEYLPGGCPTGFRHVRPEGHFTKMFQVRKHKDNLKIVSVPVKTQNLHPGDCFVLDAPDAIYVLEAEGANPSEKYEANKKAEEIESSREGRAKVTKDCDDKFWNLVEGPKPDWAKEKSGPTEEETRRKKSLADAGGIYPLSELQKPGHPDDVNPAHKERHLSDAEFQEVFGMTKSDFEKLAGWKQAAEKKKHNLF